MKKKITEKKLWKWVNDFFPVFRSITSEGIRYTLLFKNVNHNQVGGIKKVHWVDQP